MKKELTEKELTEKYSNIEYKIPSVWKTYEEAGINLAQDLAFTWDVSNGELIRVIALMEIRCKGLNINHHIDQRYSYAGLYPHIMKSFDILPDVNKDVLDEIIKKRNG
jgi:hypothetical protein